MNNDVVYYKALWDGDCVGHGITPEDAIRDAIDGLFFDYGVRVSASELRVVEVNNE